MRRALVDVIRCFLGRVFEYFAFGRGMQQVRIDRERRFAPFVFGNRDLVLFSKVEQFGARRQIPFAPRRDDLNVRIECVSRQFEAHLIVALAGCTVGNGVGTCFSSNLDQSFRNQRPRDGGAKQIDAFVHGVGAEHREDEVADEFLANVFDVDVFRLDPQHHRFFARWFQFFALPQVGGEGHDLTPVLRLQPLQNDRGIEAARIGEHNFFGCRHGFSFNGFAGAITCFSHEGQEVGASRAHGFCSKGARYEGLADIPALIQSGHREFGSSAAIVAGAVSLAKRVHDLWLHESRPNNGG